MKYRGHIQNGKIVLDDAMDLPNGTRVRVEPITQITVPKRGSAEAILLGLGKWDGPPGELEHLIEEIQRIRDEDILPLRDDLK